MVQFLPLPIALRDLLEDVVDHGRAGVHGNVRALRKAAVEGRGHALVAVVRAFIFQADQIVERPRGLQRRQQQITDRLLVLQVAYGSANVLQDDLAAFDPKDAPAAAPQELPYVGVGLIVGVGGDIVFVNLARVKDWMKLQAWDIARRLNSW